jgi:hypothetical protein
VLAAVEMHAGVRAEALGPVAARAKEFTETSDAEEAARIKAVSAQFFEYLRKGAVT